MFAALEEFFKAHHHTIAALGVAGTFSAVHISLTVALLAQRSNRPRIRARVAINIILHSSIEGPDYPTYVTVDVTNVSLVPVSIPMSFFFWKIPFRRGLFLVMPLDCAQADQWIAPKTYPVEIKPRTSVSFILSDIETFRKEVKDKLMGQTFLERLQFRFLRARLRSADGRMFSARLDKSFVQECKKIAVAPMKTP